MKTFLLSFIQRIGDLILKLISMKVVVAVVISIIYLGKPESLGIFGFLSVVLVWLAVVGLRYAEKVKGLLPIPGVGGGAGGRRVGFGASAPEAQASEASPSAEARS